MVVWVNDFIMYFILLFYYYDCYYWKRDVWVVGVKSSFCLFVGLVLVLLLGGLWMVEWGLIIRCLWVIINIIRGVFLDNYYLLVFMV